MWIFGLVGFVCVVVLDFLLLVLFGVVVVWEFLLLFCVCVVLLLCCL